MNIKSFFQKFTKNQLIIAGCTIGVILILIIFCSIDSANKVKIGFYGISEVQQTAFKKELKDMKKNSNSAIRIKYKVFDSTIPLSSQNTKHCDLILTKSGKTVTEITSDFSKGKKERVAFDKNLNSGTTVNINNLTNRLESGKLSDVPVLMDNIEIDLNKEYINKTKTKNIATLNQLEQFALKEKNDLPFVFAFNGENPSSYLDFISICVESLSGKESLVSAEAIINSTTDGNYDMNSLCAQENSPLYDTVRMIQAWEKDGVLTSDVYKMSDKTVHALMQNNNVPVVVTTLSDHRTIEANVISKYESLPELSEQRTPYVPSFRSNANRSSVCSAITLVPVSNKRKNKAIARYLLSRSTQERLSRSTGLSPVLAQCKTPDIQADDARYWISAVSTASLSLADSAFASDAERSAFITQLKDYILATK